LLIGCFSLVFGKGRGARAARRFVYELSWRLAGATTYRARGLPGRLFYAES
jgi:spore maturation protein CgeB